MWSLGKLLSRESGTDPASAAAIAVQEGAGAPDKDANIELTNGAGDAAFIAESLIKYNLQQAGPSSYRTLTVAARDQAGQLVGGIAGCTYWGWLIVECFWIHESRRGRGLGSRLLRAAEQEAIARGCHSSQLESFSFQNWQFYEAQGYERYGTLNDFPFEQQRFSFRKRLGNTAGPVGEGARQSVRNVR
jgi:GNAT superfamily N-acetyltransferase